MLVYEITSYQGCHHEPFNEPIQQGPMSVSISEDEQIIGQPWDFQRKYDTTKFFTSSQGRDSSLSDSVIPVSCDV